VKQEVPSNNRISHWGNIEEAESRVLRVITLDDGETVHMFRCLCDRVRLCRLAEIRPYHLTEIRLPSRRESASDGDRHQ
jgi:hypothetical protein